MWGGQRALDRFSSSTHTHSQCNSEEDRSRDRRQRETPQRQGACCRHGPHNAGTDRCERKLGFYQGAFCVRAKGEWEG